MTVICYNKEQWLEGQARYFELMATIPPATIPSFAKPVTIDTLDELCQHFPEHSHFANNPFTNRFVKREMQKDLWAKRRIPCDWFVFTDCVAPASYYEYQSVGMKYRPHLLPKRVVGTVRNTLVDMLKINYPPQYQNAITEAKYLRLGNVNDVFCLPPTDRVKTKWGCETLVEAVTQRRCLFVWVVEGVKKAQWLMEHTDNYAVAVSGCWQFADGKRCLPTLKWFIEQGIHLNVVTDVDYISNPDVYNGVNAGVATMLKADASITLYRTLSELETMTDSNLFDVFSPSNVAPEQYGKQTAKGFKWNNSGIDDVGLVNGELPVKKISKVTEKPSGVTPKDVVLGYLRVIDSHLAVLIGEGTNLYYYDTSQQRYCQVVPGDSFYMGLIDYCSDTVLSSGKVRNATLFMEQTIAELPTVALLVKDLGVKRIIAAQYNSQPQPLALKGGFTIGVDGSVMESSPSIFTTRALDVSMEDLEAAYERMCELDWSPLRDLAQRLDIATTANTMGISVFEAVKRIAKLEILLPATGGSINGTEAVFFQTCCSGAGKTVADAALARILGLDNVATNINLESLATNRFAKYELKDKLIATSSDCNTLSELQETALRNSFGNTIVEQKHQPATKCLLTPVFRLSSNYDKPYTSDVAGAMSRRTIIKRYVKPLKTATWETNYKSPVDMYFDMYAALLYEALVIEAMSRDAVDELFKVMASACNAKAQPLIANTGELVVERGCYYTGEDTDRITLMNLHSVAVNLAPLYGINSAKNVLNLHDALRAMEIKHSTEQAQEAGLNPVRLVWDNYYKDWALVGYRFDREWLTMTANEVLKTSHSGSKAQAAIGLLTYFRLIGEAPTDKQPVSI